MRTRPHVAWVAGIATVTALSLVVLLGGAARPAQAGPPEDAVLDWNTYASEALINAASAPIPRMGQGPTVAILHLAMVQGAVYDAVNLIDGGHAPYLDDLPAAPASASKPAAVATAAHHVLVGHGHPAGIPAGDPRPSRTGSTPSLAAIADGAAKTAGIAAGEAAAAKMLEASG